MLYFLKFLVIFLYIFFFIIIVDIKRTINKEQKVYKLLFCFQLKIQNTTILFSFI